MSGSPFGSAAGERANDTPGWGCFTALGLAGLGLFAFTGWVWRQPKWDVDMVGGLLMVILAATFGGIGLYRLVDRLFPRRPEAPGQGPTPDSLRWPARDVCLERTRPTAEGVALLWGVAAFWNVPVGVAALGVYRLFAQGWQAVPPLLFVTFFALFGLVLLALAGYATVEEWPRLRGLRPAQVTVSTHPLRPAGCYELTVQQPGPIHLRELQVVILCEIQVPHPDGEGGTYNKQETAFQAELVREEDLQLPGVLPYSARRRFSLPADARPSSQPGSNEVCWKVAVLGRRPGWRLSFAFDYPVTVIPPAEPHGTATARERTA
jgi:hypothetical protein